MAKPNYGFEKRQRDLRKKQKQEEKRQRKLAVKNAAKGDSPELESPADRRDPEAPDSSSEPSSGA
ncbi:MAG: hypothetical protein ACRET1_06170 [Burkholderiales bacterium]